MAFTVTKHLSLSFYLVFWVLSLERNFPFCSLFRRKCLDDVEVLNEFNSFLRISKHLNVEKGCNVGKIP